jgi:iron complex transport system substrate-binding protein
MRPIRIALALLAGLVLFAAACGDADDAADPGEGTTTTTPPAEEPAEPGDDEDAFPVTVGGATIEQRPQRIVSLSPTATEVLFAIGAGEQVVAVDDQSNHPDDAPLSDLSGFDPNLEAIAAHDPDLVVVSFDPIDLTSALGQIGVPVLVQAPALDFDDAYAQIEQLGAATGNLGGAAQVVADTRARVDAAIAEVEEVDRAVSVYHELDDTFFTASSASFIGEVYAQLGLENIADAADPDGTGFPQLSAEYILEADPDLIVITQEIGYGPEEVAARPGWDQITAVANGDIVQVDSDLASRWGPRFVEFLELMAQRVTQLQPAGA